MLDIFSRKDWERIKGEYEDWWKFRREKPVLHLTFTGADPGMKRPEGLITGNYFEYDDNETAEQIAEKAEYMMRCQRYEYQAYPHTFLYFGPLHCVEYIGCRPEVRPGTVWFAPEKVVPPEQLSIKKDPDSVHFPKDMAIRKAMEKRFGGGYVPSYGGGFPGSGVDIVAQFYGPEELIYMLYDEPDEVKRLVKESGDVLLDLMKEATAATPRAEGYTSWGGIYAPVPWANPQCDFCAMIGPQLFDEFVLPDIVEGIKSSPDYNYYHLDGPGEIIHMDKILAIPELKCMQWVPGPQSNLSMDLEVHERIHKAGKNTWVMGDIEKVLQIAEHNGTGKGIYWNGTYPMSEYDRVMKIAEELMKG